MSTGEWWHEQSLERQLELGGSSLVCPLAGAAWQSNQPTATSLLQVLYGLPRLLTGSILAHECMHAWLRMSGFSASASHLPEQVEEGLCQLMALLWLEAQQALVGGGSRERAGV